MKLPPWRIFARFGATPEHRREDVIDADYRAVFQSERGSRVLADIMQMASIFNSTISTDRVVRDITDGKRELALAIAERAGFMSEKLPAAIISDDLRKAASQEAGNDDTDDRPLFVRDDPDDAIITDGD